MPRNAQSSFLTQIPQLLNVDNARNWCYRLHVTQLVVFITFRSPIHKHCRKTCSKTRHKIIITQYLRCHKIILQHIINEFTEFIFNDRSFFHEGDLLSW